MIESSKNRLSSGLLLLALISTCFPFAARAQADDTYRIGVIIPLSGPAAAVGQAISNGLALAGEEIKRRKEAPLEIYFEDDAASGMKSVSAYRKLRDEHRINLAVGAFSSNGHSLVPLAEKDGVTFITIAADPSIVAGRQRAFELWSPLDAAAARAVQEVKLRQLSPLALVNTVHQGNIAFKEAFLAAAEAAVQISSVQEIMPDERDFSSYMIKIRSSGARAVANFLHPAQAGVFARQARESGLRLPQFSLFNFEDRSVVETSGGALIGQWYVGLRQTPSFVKTYRARFPAASVFAAANGHDAALLAAEARKQGVKPADFPAWLHRLHRFSGALGVYSARADNCFDIESVVKTVTTDGFEEAVETK